VCFTGTCCYLCACRYRLGRAKSPDGQKSSDEETEDKATSSSADVQRKTTSTDCKKTDPPVSCREQKTASDKDLTKSDDARDKKNCDEQKKGVTSQQTDEGIDCKLSSIVYSVRHWHLLDLLLPFM